MFKCFFLPDYPVTLTRFQIFDEHHCTKLTVYSAESSEQLLTLGTEHLFTTGD